MRVTLVVSLLLTLAPFFVSHASSQTAQRSWRSPTEKAFDRETLRQKVNENVVMLLAGQLGEPYIQLAQDIAVAVDDADKLRVLPVASGGAVKNVRDILLLRGADLGISTVQALNDLKASGEFGPQLERQIAYVAALSVDAFHVLARPGIASIRDLTGKTVAFNTKGSGTQRFGPKVFKQLGIEVKEAHMLQGDALEAMRKGEVEATVCSCALPVPAYPVVNPEWGFKLLEVPYVPALEQDYVPATLTSANYPNLIAPDGRVRTIATSTVLVTFNWGPGTDRYRKIEAFVNAFFANVDKLMQPPRHPAWKQFNIAASIKNWQRFPAAKQWLDRQAADGELKAKVDASGLDVARARAQATNAAPNDTAEQERLFKEFIEWSRSRPRR
jgi:TRAP-type uncharacterized transport system substrate-binding protein